MKKLFLLAFLALGLMTSCQKDDFVAESVKGNPDFEAIALLDEDLDTRTQLSEKDANGYKTLWASGDAISIFNAGSHYKYKLNEGAGELLAYFKYDPSFGEVSGGIESESNSDVFAAVYPFAKENTVAKVGNDYVFNTVIPTKQNYAPGSFGQDAAPMVAVNKTTPRFSFKNIGSVIVMPLKGEVTIVSATLESKSHKVAGKAVVTASAANNFLPVVNVEGGESKIALSCNKGGVALDPTTPTNFFFVLAPGTYEANDLVVTFYDSYGNYLKTEITKENTFVRSKTYTFAARTFAVTGAEKLNVWVKAQAGAYMDAERLIPSFMATKSILDDAKELASWVKNLKDKPNTKDLIEEAIGYISIKNYKAAYKILDGIPGFELQTLRFKAVGEHMEKVDFTGVSYLKSFVGDIYNIENAADLIAFMNEFEKVYEASGIKNKLNEQVGKFSDTINGYIDSVSDNNFVKAALKTAVSGIQNLSVVELVEKAVADPNSAAGKLLNSLFANETVMNGIKNALVKVVEEIETASKESIDNTNVDAKKAAIEVAKTNAILNARLDAGEIIMKDFNGENASNLANLNDGPWGKFKSLLNRKECVELFTQCDILDVYSSLTKLIERVESIVLYDKGTTYYDIENISDYKENVDWWLLSFE